jgi:acetylornithine deacetylase/succinyl-diaminopimelate desuccinylase-like protein
MTESHTEWTPHPVTAAVDWDAVTAEATAALSAYVRIDSSHPAGDCTAAAAFWMRRLADDGIAATLYDTGVPGKVNLLARLKAENPVGKPLLISNHMDVVQAVASDWTFDPYSGEVADGYVYGREARCAAALYLR